MAVTVSSAASTQEKLVGARAASAKLALLSTEEKNALLFAIAEAMEANQKSILEANRADVENSGLEGAMRDRLLLTPARIKDMARGVREVAVIRQVIVDGQQIANPMAWLCHLATPISLRNSAARPDNSIASLKRLGYAQDRACPFRRPKPKARRNCSKRASTGLTTSPSATRRRCSNCAMS